MECECRTREEFTGDAASAYAREHLECLWDDPVNAVAGFVCRESEYYWMLYHPVSRAIDEPRDVHLRRQKVITSLSDAINRHKPKRSFFWWRKSSRCRCQAEHELPEPRGDEYAAQYLVELWYDPLEWLTVYVCFECMAYWVKEYPHAELHGGGPPRLRRL